MVYWSRSLEIFKLDQALHAFRSEVTQLNKNIQRFSAKELIELRAEIDTEIENFEVEVNAFAEHCCEVERMHHQSVLEDIRKFGRALVLPPPIQQAAVKEVEEILVASIRVQVSQIPVAIRDDLIACMLALFQVITSLLRMLTAKFALSWGSFFKQDDMTPKKEMFEAEEVASDDESSDGDLSKTWSDVPDTEDEEDERASPVKESKIKFVPF